MDNALRNAVLLSSMIHAAVLGPSVFSISFEKDRPDDKPMVVEYVVTPDVVAPEVPTQRIQFRVKETPKIELKDKIKAKPAPGQHAKKTVKEAIATQEAAKKEAAIKSTRDYINYYQLIREKIRSRLKKNYTNYSSDGEVLFMFILGSDGSLVKYEIDKAQSTKDAALLDVASTSLREASPFPPFPRELSVPQMSFNLIVSFKRK